MGSENLPFEEVLRVKRTLLAAATATVLMGFSANANAQTDPMVEQCAATYQFMSLVTLMQGAPDGKIEALSEQDKRIFATLYARGKSVLVTGGVIKSLAEDYPQSITDQAIKIGDTIGDKAGADALLDRWSACDKHFKFDPIPLD